jgi:hypothetical protein
VNENGKKNKNRNWQLAIHLLEEHLTRRNVQQNLDKMGRISVDKFGGKKGDLSRAVQETVGTWGIKKQ